MYRYQKFYIWPGGSMPAREIILRGDFGGFSLSRIQGNTVNWICRISSTVLNLGLAWWRGKIKSYTVNNNILVSHMSKLNVPDAWSKVADILDIEPLIVSLSCLLNYWIGDLKHISCISRSAAVNTALLIECIKVEHFFVVWSLKLWQSIWKYDWEFSFS